MEFACPACGADEKSRERRPDGNSKCVNGHEYPSRAATLKAPPHNGIKKLSENGKRVVVEMSAAEFEMLNRWKATPIVENALRVVNDAANRERHRGNYALANELVAARVTLYRASKIGGG